VSIFSWRQNVGARPILTAGPPPTVQFSPPAAAPIHHTGQEEGNGDWLKACVATTCLHLTPRSHRVHKIFSLFYVLNQALLLRFWNKQAVTVGTFILSVSYFNYRSFIQRLDALFLPGTHRIVDKYKISLKNCLIWNFIVLGVHQVYIHLSSRVLLNTH
jgi:hypothetical protein